MERALHCDVGGRLKRIEDRIVSREGDIDSFLSFVNVLRG